MTARQELVQQLIEDEGIRYAVYDDATGQPLRAGMMLTGNASVGVGRNLSGAGLTDHEVMVLLDHDLDACIQDLSTFAWFPPLDVVRQRAVISLRFNVGPNGFRMFRRFIAAMARLNYAVAGQEIEQSKLAVARKKRLRAMIETGED